MAQHIPLQSFPQKRIQKIYEAIKNTAFVTIKGSLKWERITQYYKPEEANGNEIYTGTRVVGKGIVWGTDTATIEIHFNQGKLVGAFLVA